MIRALACFCACAATATAAAASAAAAAGPLSVTTRLMVEERRAAPDGTTRIVLATPDRVGPGDRVVVLVGYRNTSAQPLSDVAIADPLPRSLAFLRAHAGSPEPELSTDGRSWVALAEQRASLGGQPATRADVTVVRWRLPHPLAPGATGELAFDAVVR